jgi:hypothetical protein
MRQGTTLQAAEKGWFPGEMPESITQGLKPVLYLVALAARLKSCPDTKPTQFRVFPQPLKSRPDAYCLSKSFFSQPVKPNIFLLN